MQLTVVLSLLLLLQRSCIAYPGGPPTSVCSDLRPQHPGSPSSGNGGYLITTNIPVSSAGNGFQYTPGATYTVTLRGTVNTFRGFAVQSVSAVDGSALGTFSPRTNQQLLGCSPAGYTIVHSNPSRIDFAEQTFTWQAPNTAGIVNFWYSVVQFRRSTGVYYVRKSAIVENPPMLPPTTMPPTTKQPDTQPPTTLPPTTLPLTTQPPDTQPPTTLPQTTKPPTTLPLTTQPPDTQPPTTLPRTTQPPDTQSPTTLPLTTQPPDTQPPTTLPLTTQPPDTQSPTTLPRTTQPPDTQSPTTLPRTTLPLTTQPATQLPPTTKPQPQTILPPPATQVPRTTDELSQENSTAAAVITPTRSATDYDLTFRDPVGCDPSACNTFIGIDTNQGNSDYLDIYMEGATEGWIAVGFTETPNMFSADVLACNFNPDTLMMEALDTWNPATRANILDTNQDVFLFSGELRDGRITCTIGRLTVGTGSQDFNLNGLYHILYGRRERDPAAGMLVTHVGVSPNPTVSSTQYNPAVRSIPSGATRNMPVGLFTCVILVILYHTLSK